MSLYTIFTHSTKELASNQRSENCTNKHPGSVYACQVITLFTPESLKISEANKERQQFGQTIQQYPAFTQFDIYKEVNQNTIAVKQNLALF